MGIDTHSAGARGEEVACDFLVREGYSIKARNVRTPYGEIDIIAEDEAALVFVEVKMRSDTAVQKRYGRPALAVNSAKRERLLNSAHFYLKENEITKRVRFDVIELLESRVAGEFAYNIRHTRAALSDNRS